MPCCSMSIFKVSVKSVNMHCRFQKKSKKVDDIPSSTIVVVSTVSNVDHLKFSTETRWNPLSQTTTTKKNTTLTRIG